MAAAPVKKSSNKTLIIIIVLIILCLILACIGTFVWVDADKSGVRWCVFPFSIIGQMLGAVCP